MVVSPRNDPTPVLQVLEQFREGWEQRDAATVLACFAQDSSVTVIGTDEGELWTGYKSLVEPFHAMVSAFSEPRYRWQDNEPKVTIHGDTAWVARRLVAQFTASGEPRELKMRSTYVFVRNEGRWQIHQAHFSVAAAVTTSY